MSPAAQQTNERILAEVEACGGGYIWEPESFAVMLLDVAVQDEQALILCGLEGVEQIALNASRLTFATLQRVAGIQGLQSLVLAGVALTENQHELLEGLGPKVEVVPPLRPGSADL